MIEVSWSIFKSFVNSRSLSIQYLDVDGFYFLWAVDGLFYIQSRLEKNGDADVLEFENSYKPLGNKKLTLANQAFDAKELPNGKKLFRRSHGITTLMIANGETTVDFVIPYNACKMNKMEIFWLPEEVKLDLKVLDTPSGTIQASFGVSEEDRVPNLEVNQFGFNVNAAKDYYVDESKYDADLIKDMVVRIVLKNSTEISKTVGINLILHEVK